MKVLWDFTKLEAYFSLIADPTTVVDLHSYKHFNFKPSSVSDPTYVACMVLSSLAFKWPYFLKKQKYTYFEAFYLGNDWYSQLRYKTTKKLKYGTFIYTFPHYSSVVSIEDTEL